MFGNRATFLSSSHRWVVLPAAHVKKEERSQQLAAAEAAAKVDAWVEDVMSWPGMLHFYELVSGDWLRPPTTLDIEEHVKPVLREAFQRGQLVVLKAPILPAAKQASEDGIHGVRHNVERVLDAIPQKPLRLLKETSFLDLQVVNTKGKPLANRRYKFTLPNGKTETSHLGAEARIRKADIDPGIAELTLLPDDGDVFEVGAETPAGAEIASSIEFVLVDQDGEPLTGQRYGIELPDGQTQSGTLDDFGAARVDAKVAGNCRVRFPDIGAA